MFLIVVNWYTCASVIVFLPALPTSSRTIITTRPSITIQLQHAPFDTTFSNHLHPWTKAFSITGKVPIISKVITNRPSELPSGEGSHCSKRGILIPFPCCAQLTQLANFAGKKSQILGMQLPLHTAFWGGEKCLQVLVVPIGWHDMGIWLWEYAGGCKSYV